MKLRMTDRHIAFLGKLALCGMVQEQITIARVAGVLGLLLDKKCEENELRQELLSYGDVDSKSIFFLLLWDRKEVTTSRSASTMLGRYIGGGLDTMIEILDKRKSDLSNITVDDIMDLFQNHIIRLKEKQ